MYASASGYSVNNADESIVQIHLKEGKFHQVKRMVKACGKTVVDLQRLTMGPLKLDESLALGESRPLTEEELESLMFMNNEKLRRNPRLLFVVERV